MAQEKGKIGIIIIHYNTPHYLPTCLDSIFAQTYKNIEVFFIDNASPDPEGLEVMHAQYENQPNLHIIANPTNLGYAGAGNQGIKMVIDAGCEYAVITNPDIIYTENYFEKIVGRIEQDHKIASITGKVYKYDFAKKVPTKIIDTVGLFAYKNRRIVDDGQGLEDEGQFDEECEVFGISGACPFYRVKALEDVKIEDEYLDNDFFMYKEDVDLSWRFLLFGWKNFYYPEAIAYHGRGTGIYRRFFNREVFKHRQHLTKFQKQFSFKNQYLMEAKNELSANFFRDFFPIVTKKILTLAYITFREPYLWKSYFQYLKQLPKILKKRKIIMSKKRISAKEMRSWFKKQSKYLMPKSSHHKR